MRPIPFTFIKGILGASLWRVPSTALCLLLKQHHKNIKYIPYYLSYCSVRCSCFSRVSPSSHSFTFHSVIVHAFSLSLSAEELHKQSKITFALWIINAMETLLLLFFFLRLWGRKYEGEKNLCAWVYDKNAGKTEFSLIKPYEGVE
jgi:hypothetical protein